MGIAWAMTGLLRAVPFHASHKRLYLHEGHLAVSPARRSTATKRRPSQH